MARLHPVTPPERSRFYEKQLTFEQDTSDVRAGGDAVSEYGALTGNCGAKNGQLPPAWGKDRYSDFDTHTSQHAPPIPSADNADPAGKELFQALQPPVSSDWSACAQHLAWQLSDPLSKTTQEQIQPDQRLDKINGNSGEKTSARAVAMGIGEDDLNPFKRGGGGERY